MFVTLWILLAFVSFISTSDGASSCDELDFPCNDGDCIDAGLWCDSHEDCFDGSDEAYCKKITNSNKNPNKCSKDFFKCDDGPCIPLRGRCDGYKSCDDNSDEKNCPSSPNSESPSVQDSNEASPVNKNPNSSKSDHTGTYLTHFDSGSGYDFDHLDDTDFEPSVFSLQREKARSWLVSQRLKDFGWGSETPRALTALYLSDVHPFRRNETDMLMIKQLEVQLSLDISRNGTKTMALADLALYINALMASCRDPRNFYGNDLVGTLRNGVNTARNAGKFVNPAVYLTLCINNGTEYNDARMLHEIFYSRNAGLIRIDIQALAMLTAICASRSEIINPQTYIGFKDQFLARLRSKRFTGNVYEAALVMQALTEAKLDEMNWKRSELTDFLLKKQQQDGSFGCILATYLALPIFSGSSLLKIGKDCNMNHTGFTPTEVLRNTQRRKIPVSYSLNFADPVEVTQILQIKVAENTSFLDIMRLAEEINPKYRFLLDDTQDIPVVYSIGAIPNDAEKGLFWTLHVASANSRSDLGRLIPYNGNIKNLQPRAGDELVFWLKTI